MHGQQSAPGRCIHMATWAVTTASCIKMTSKQHKSNAHCRLLPLSSTGPAWQAADGHHLPGFLQGALGGGGADVPGQEV